MFMRNLNIKNSKKKAPHSKSLWILIWVQALATITVVFSFWAVKETGDTSALTVLIPSVFVDASAVTALVLWKRKNENVFAFFQKDEMRQTIEWFNEHGIDPIEFFRALKE